MQGCAVAERKTLAVVPCLTAQLALRDGEQVTVLSFEASVTEGNPSNPLLPQELRACLLLLVVADELPGLLCS